MQLLAQATKNRLSTWVQNPAPCDGFIRVRQKDENGFYYVIDKCKCKEVFKINAFININL
jgi:hypothetical protein